MKYKHTNKNHSEPTANLLPWDALMEKGNLLLQTKKRLSLTPNVPYLVTKSCTDGTFKEGDIILLDLNSDLFCPKTGQRITPGQCKKGNMDFSCIPADTGSGNQESTR